MLLNIILLFLVFGASKTKFNPYAAAAVFGGIKAVVAYFLSQNILIAVISFFISGILAAGLVYFLARLDREEETEEPYPKYGIRKKGKFKWEYIPLSVIVFLIIFAS